MIDEWEKRLQVLTAKYEDDLQRKKDKNIERVCFFTFKDFDRHLIFIGINNSFYKRKS